jgi:hypothetical protein
MCRTFPSQRRTSYNLLLAYLTINDGFNSHAYSFLAWDLPEQTCRSTPCVVKLDESCLP